MYANFGLSKNSLFYILATSKVISGWISTYDSAHSCQVQIGPNPRITYWKVFIMLLASVLIDSLGDCCSSAWRLSIWKIMRRSTYMVFLSMRHPSLVTWNCSWWSRICIVVSSIEGSSIPNTSLGDNVTDLASPSWASRIGKRVWYFLQIQCLILSQCLHIAPWLLYTRVRCYCCHLILHQNIII